MDELLILVSSAFEAGQEIIDANDKRFSNAEDKLQSYLRKAKDTLVQKQLAIQKPAKRPMRTIQDEAEESESESLVIERKSSSELSVPVDKVLRPTRTAKAKANLNLKEVLITTKMRNDNNTVVKTERVSSQRQSVKENREPVSNSNTNKGKSPDEGIQSTTESEPDLAGASKRSNSVECLIAKAIEIDITSGDDNDKMPPPAIPKKAGKKTRTKQKKPIEEDPEVEPQSSGLRVTRSKIKQEKVSIDMNPTVSVDSETTEIDTMSAGVSKKGSKKKYPMPILVKMETPEETTDKITAESPAIYTGDATFNVPAPVMNETVTISANPNTTVTLENNPHYSLMTEDNDDDEDDLPLVKAKPQKQMLPPLPALKLKKNEVFNPYLQSPVKQKVQAFEKHAVQGAATPASSSKYNSLKSGTPSKIALYSKTTTPLNIAKTSKSIISCSTAPMMPSIGAKPLKPYKKGVSLTQEPLDESKKLNSIAATAQLEEKRKIREEKMRQAHLQREALEKEKRDQAVKLQIEREEKYRKMMKEKEDKVRMDVMKKKLLKEKQAKKFAEERAKKDEFVVPKPVDSLNESLHLKLQKQIILEKQQKNDQKKKIELKNTYCFEMLNTDDETDDESRPSIKRPPVPKWSQKTNRKQLIINQSYSNESVLDQLFSSQPIQVDLKEIFPNIDSRKLIRNSSAVWKTPPKHYHTNL